MYFSNGENDHAAKRISGNAQRFTLTLVALKFYQPAAC